MTVSKENRDPETLAARETAEREARAQYYSTLEIVSQSEVPTIEQIEAELAEDEDFDGTVETSETMGNADDLKKDLQTWIKAAARLIIARRNVIEFEESSDLDRKAVRP